MAKVNSAQDAQTKRVFIGRAWANKVKQGERAGTEFLSLRIDRGVDVSLTTGDQITLWPNRKREGKQDADFRASIQVPA